MLKRLKEKKNAGFTLAELLIVVAIIAVLAAVAIPIFTAQLNRSRAATDVANIRAGYADVSSKILMGEINSSGTVAVYLQNDGTVSENPDKLYKCKGYAKNADKDATVGGFTVGEGKNIVWTSGQKIKYTITNADGTVSVTGIAGENTTP